jgi:abortive infection alpha-like protein
MFALTRVVKDLMASPGRSGSAPASERAAGLRTLARVALGPMAALPRTALGLPELLLTIGQRGSAIPPARRRTPNATLALKALAGVVRSAGTIRDSYLSLLTATMDRAVADDVHPAFIDLLGQLSDDELLLLATLGGPGPYPLVSVSSRLRHGGASRVELHHFSLLGERAGCARPDHTPAYLDNLSRLGLVEIRPTRITDDVRMFHELETHPQVTSVRTRIESQPEVSIGPISEAIVADVQYKSLFVTPFGRQFRGACFFRPEHDTDLARPPS